MCVRAETDPYGGNNGGNGGNAGGYGAYENGYGGNYGGTGGNYGGTGGNYGGTGGNYGGTGGYYGGTGDYYGGTGGYYPGYGEPGGDYGIRTEACNKARVGDEKYCDDDKCGPCYEGEGDCDDDADCAGNLVCVRDVGEQFGMNQEIDVCLRWNIQCPMAMNGPDPAAGCNVACVAHSYNCGYQYAACMGQCLAGGGYDPAYVSCLAMASDCGQVEACGAD